MGQLAGKIAQTFGSNAVETHVDGLPDQKIAFEIGPAGLEPATPCLEGRCSIHLSYGPKSCNTLCRSLTLQSRTRNFGITCVSIRKSAPSQRQTRPHAGLA